LNCRKARHCCTTGLNGQESLNLDPKRKEAADSNQQKKAAAKDKHVPRCAGDYRKKKFLSIARLAGKKKNDIYSHDRPQSAGSEGS